MPKPKKQPTTNTVIPSQTETKQDNIPKNIANIQNNFNFAQNIDLEKLSYLSAQDTELAKRVMFLYEEQFSHAKEIDKSIVTLEKEEQRLRKREIPYQRKFIFRSLGASWSVSIFGLALSGFAMYMHYPWVASTAIVIPIGVVAVNMLGIKNQNQK